MIPRLTRKIFLKILFAPLLWLVHACSPLGNPVDEEKSKNHYYNKDKSDIQYSPGGNWFNIGNSPMNADVESFEVLTSLISRDKNRWYFTSDPVQNDIIDSNSFYIKEGDYMDHLCFDENYVYFFKNDNSIEPSATTMTRLEGANPKTFTQNDPTWANDDQNHFYLNELINVDFDSFENLSYTFSKDARSAYAHFDSNFKVITADASSFRALDDFHFAMDDLHVYAMDYGEYDLDDSRLVTISKTVDEKVSLLNEVFIKIGNRIFFRGTHLADLNSENVEIINYSYIKDDTTVYFEDKKLIDADAPTFKDLGKRKVGDKNGSFDEGSRVK